MTYSVMQNKVFNIFKDAFGEDKVFRYSPLSNPELIYKDYDENYFMYISVQYPDFYIKNPDKGKESKHLIRGLIGIYIINTEGELEEELWERSIFNFKEWEKRYTHSHLQQTLTYRLCTYEEDENGDLTEDSIDYDDESDFCTFHTKFSGERLIVPSKFCYGRDESFFEDVRYNIRELKSKANLLMNWEFYVDNILEVLSQESTEGGPYINYSVLYVDSNILPENVYDNRVKKRRLKNLFKKEAIKTFKGDYYTIDSLLCDTIEELTKEEEIIIQVENTVSIIYPIIMKAFRKVLERKISILPDNLSKVFRDSDNNSTDTSLLDLVLITERGIAIRDNTEDGNLNIEQEVLKKEIQNFPKTFIPTITKQGYPIVRILQEEEETDNYRYELSVRLCKLITDYLKRKSDISNTVPNEYF